MSPALTEDPLQSMTASNGTSNGHENPKKRRLYCLTICSYRKAGMSEQQYEEYMANTHSKICKGLMAKYGVLRWHVAINTEETRKVVPVVYTEEFARTHAADYDCFSQAIFEDYNNMVAMKKDPHYDAYIKADPLNFADTDRTIVTIGWFDEYIFDGKVV